MGHVALKSERSGLGSRGFGRLNVQCDYCRRISTGENCRSCGAPLPDPFAPRVPEPRPFVALATEDSGKPEWLRAVERGEDPTLGPEWTRFLGSPRMVTK